MSWFSSAAGALGGALLDNFFADNRQEDQQSFNAQQFATRYQTQVKDMAAAGLNPMLSYSQSPGAGATSGISAPGGQFSAAAANMQTAKLNEAQIDNLQAQARKTTAEAVVAEGFGLKQAEANFNQTLAQTGLTASQQANVQSQTDNNIAMLNNIKLEGDRLVKAAELLYQQSNLTFQQQLTETQRYDMIKAQAKLYLAQTGLANLDLQAANALENAGRIGGQIKPFFDMLRSLLRK